MGLPRVSIIWLNYNSMKIINLVLESLQAVSGLDYPRDKYELIVVDNGSTDGSIETITSFLDTKEGLRKKIIKLSKNLGFAGGSNIGFKARDKESKYVVLLNNDAVPFKESLETMAEYAEQYDVGGLNGIILKYGENGVIDTAGDILDELLSPHLVGSEQKSPWIIKKPFCITYADGAYALYRVESVLKTMNERLFLNEFFAYGDDIILGLMLWNKGYKIISIPENVAVHSRSSSFGKDLTANKAYFGERVGSALIQLTNTRWKSLFWLHRMRTTISKVNRKKVVEMLVRAQYDGIVLGEELRKKYRLFIDIYKAPILKITLGEFLNYFLLGTKAKMQKHMEKKISQVIKRLEVD